MKYSEEYTEGASSIKLRDSSMVRNMVDIVMKNFNINGYKFMLPKNKTRDIDLYVKFKTEDEGMIDNIVEQIKEKTGKATSQVSAFLHDRE